MKKIKVSLIFTLLFSAPISSFALGDLNVCLVDGYTIATINGIFTSEREAQENMLALEKKLGFSRNQQDIAYQYLHNPTHFLGGGDLVKVLAQTIAKDQFIDDHDLFELVTSASEKVSTQKLLLVAHSQGNFYANAFYKKVADAQGGVPAQSLGVYSVATPANHVSGDGRYLTSGSDKVITSLPTALSPNDYIELKSGDDPRGHSFADVYLKYRAPEIVDGITWSLDRLQTNDIQKENERCLAPPDPTIITRIDGALLAVGDFYLNNGVDLLAQTPKGVYSGSVALLDAGVATMNAVGNATIYVAEATAKGVYHTGVFVADTSVKLASATLAVGKSVVHTVASVFSKGPEQTASVAQAGTSVLTVDANSIAQSVSKSAEEAGSDTPAPSPAPEPPTEHSDILKNVRMSDDAEEENVRSTEDVSHGEDTDSIEKSTSEGEVVHAVTEGVPTTDTNEGYIEPSGYYRLSPPGGGGGGVSQPASEETTSTAVSTPSDTTPPDAPVVSSPSTQASYTTTGVTFSGTAESGSIVSNNFSNATTSADGSGAWSLSLTLSQGTNDILWYATDTSGNKSTASPITILVDSERPDVSLTSSTCDGTLSSSSCLVTTTSLAFSWSSGASDLSHFVLDKNGTVSTTTATSTSVTASNESTYTLKVSAVDTSGNTSATSTQAVTVYTMPVVINEVAWAGTEASAFDEWIELYNRTDKAISLGTFVLHSTDLTPYIPLSGTIGANSYFLIERTDDTTVDSVSGDLVTPFSGDSGSGLDNNGDPLILVVASGGATTTIDSMPTCVGGGTSWCAGSSTSGSRRTMERYNDSMAGSSSSNWGSHLGEFILNGTDADGASIKGTPKARNSISYLLSQTGTISEDTTLTSSRSPYLVNRIPVTVSAGTTLTIDPGVVVKVVSPSAPWINVKGTLLSNGTASNPVIFTSFFDDNHGGDTNGDGSATTPSAGSWKRLFFDTTSTGSSLAYTQVLYGGGNSTPDPTAQKGAIGVDSSTVTFDHVTVENSNSNGISLYYSNSTVSNSTFSSSTNSTFSSSGVLVTGGSPTISDSTFAHNYRGITTSATTPTIRSNTITGSSQEAIYNSGVVGSFSGNSGSGNGYNAIMLSGGSAITSSGATTTLSANALPYLVKGTVTVVSDSTLAFGTGVVVKGWDSTQSQYGQISVSAGGTLYSSGTTPSDLIFTTIADSTVGGTVKSNLYTPSAGNWKGITIDAGGRITLSGFTLKYAGATAHLGLGKNGGAFKITGSAATSSGFISNALFSDNYQSGLNINTVSGLTVSDVTLQNHTSKYTGEAVGLYAVNSASTLSNITFSGNERDAVGTGVNALTCTNCGTPNTTPADLLSP